MTRKLKIGSKVTLLDGTRATVVRIDERGILVLHTDGRYVYLPDWY